MTPSKFIDFLNSSLASLTIGKEFNGWSFNGKTEIAYGTKGGSWNPKQFPGYLFSSLESNKKFVLRPVNSKGNEIIAMESVHNTGQLINHQLKNIKNFSSKNDVTTLHESFNMTVGKGRVKTQIAKSALIRNGLNPNGIVLAFEDDKLTIEDLINGLLKWAVIRENAKNEIRKEQKSQSEVIENKMEVNIIQSKKENALNSILYGPPGTGKTFNTINQAISIINPAFDLKQERSKIKEEYSRLVKDGQIIFTTFHQSMSYEDFIEGIKPIKPNQEDTSIKYDIEDGIFKIACANAGYLCYKKSESLKSSESRYNFDDLYDAFVEYYQKYLNEKKEIIFKSLTGKEITILNINGNDSIISRSRKSIAKKKPAPLTKENLQKLYDKFSSIEEITNLQQIQETVEVTPRKTEFYAVFKALKEFEASEFRPEELESMEEGESMEEEEKLVKYNAGVFKNSIKQYSKVVDSVVLIIDEINRGNVSAIFGELITLIEDDKRMGREESIEIILPYSKQKFSVPSNLYIIGTMNTADRSVESLDTALRRRFSFVEMLPQPELIASDGKSKETGGKIGEINLVKLLEIINERIEVLVDRDHTIGHAYLMDVFDEVSLKNAFKNKIIPLLQEYFYGNYEKMEMVIGSSFFEDLSKKSVEFAVKNHSYDDLPKRYKLKTIDDQFDIKTAIDNLLNIKSESAPNSENE